MLESLRNNMKLLKSSKRHVLLFELAYKLLALAVFYPVITGVIRLCMRITGINYLTNEYIAKAFMNPVIIIFCLLGVIGFIVYCLYEMEMCIRDSYTGDNQDTCIVHCIVYRLSLIHI